MLALKYGFEFHRILLLQSQIRCQCNQRRLSFFQSELDLFGLCPMNAAWKRGHPPSKFGFRTFSERFIRSKFPSFNSMWRSSLLDLFTISGINQIHITHSGGLLAAYLPRLGSPLLCLFSQHLLRCPGLAHCVVGAPQVKLSSGEQFSASRTAGKRQRLRLLVAPSFINLVTIDRME